MLIPADPRTDEPPPAASVLVADGNPVVRMFVQRLLMDLGCEARVVTSGHDVLAMLEREPYGLVLMDVETLDIDGLELAAEIRRREALGTYRVPIVAMTWCADPVDRERCLAAGIDGHVSKPVQRHELAQALREWLPAGRAMTQGDELPLDIGWLRRLLPRDEDAVRSVLAMFVGRGIELLADMTADVRSGDMDALRSHAHALKGISGTVGARRLHGRLSGDPALLSRVLPELEQDFAELRGLIERELARP